MEKGLALIFVRKLGTKERVKQWTEVLNSRREDTISIIEEIVKKLDQYPVCSTQFDEIYLGLKTGINVSQIKAYVDPEFTSVVMKKIRYAEYEEISKKLCQDYNLDPYCKEKIIAFLKNGLNVERIKVFLSQELDDAQMQQIYLGYKNGLTDEQIKVYARKEFCVDTMMQIRVGYENGLTDKQVMVYAKPEFDLGQMGQIRLGYEKGLTDEQVKFYAKPEFDSGQMSQIRLGYEKGLTNDQVKFYAKSEIDPGQMGQIRL